MEVMCSVKEFRAVVGYHKRDTLSKNRKESLGLAYINAKGRSQGLGRFSDSPETRTTTTLRLAEALSPEAPPRKASDGLPILRFARGRLGNNLVASASTDFSDKTSRVQPLSRRQPHVGTVQ